MEFDKRIIDPNDNIWTPFGSTAEQEICVGLEGYFTDCYYDFEDLSNCNYATLTEIDWDSKYPFHVTNEKGDVGRYCFFLPTRDVKAKEKKYRPFTVDEFLERFPLLSSVVLRNNSENKAIAVKYVTGYSKTHPRVYLGVVYGLEELFTHYEYQDEHGNWLPFGVEE